MFSVFRHHVSVGSFMGMVADMVLLFGAVLLAGVTQAGVGQVGLTPSGLGELVSSHTGPGGFQPFALHQMVLFAAQFALVVSLMYSFAGLYRPTPIGVPTLWWRTVVAMGVGAYLTYLVLGLVVPTEYLKLLLGSAIVYALIGLVFVRAALYWLRHVRARSRVLIVGTGAEAYAVASDLAALTRASNNVIGFYPSGDEVPAHAGAASPPVFSREASIPELVARHRIDQIIVAEREQRGGGVPMDELLACRIRGIPVMDLAGYWERTKSEVPIDSLKSSWLVYGEGFVQGRARRLAKRAFDTLCSGALLVITSPVMLLTVLAIKLDSPGPIIYRQERVGKGGQLFWCLKFRSMRSDAERDGVARWAAKNDSRVTRVGAFIRKTRIDELPQLLSVLKGEMSLVGPRPERPSFVAQLKEQIPFYDVRHSVKPGVTGWAQVRYSYGASLEDARRKHQFDLYYVKNNSLFLDLLVLIETVSVVLFREGQ
ncbi:MAG: TIGR03013 family XrtA/PEP-CTERM system glycosyltransferase [Burkholderiaceae bacterium]